MIYGGDYAIKGQSPLMWWLHCNKKLSDSGLGKFEGYSSNGIYTYTQDDTTKKAISYGVANAKDFLILSGVCVWPQHNISLKHEVKRGVFEVVDSSNVEGVFCLLQRHHILTGDNLSNKCLCHA